MSNRELLELQEEIETLKARLVDVESRSRPRLRWLLARLPSSKPVRLVLIGAVVAVAAVSYAATVSVPYTFVNGTVADATEVNANFSALVTESNAQDSRLATLEASMATVQGQVAVNTADIGAVESDVTTLQSGVATNTSDIATNTSDIATNASDIATNTSDIGTLQTDVGTNTGNIGTNTAGIATLNTTFAGVSRGGTPDTLTFSGMNVQLVDGSGDTYGAVNGRGNLIVGYNENTVSATRTGSHNIIVGWDHEYTSIAGLVAGQNNTVTGASSSVSGGKGNTASGGYSSVSGGENNEASGSGASVSGGALNKAMNWVASVSGGQSNRAAHDFTSVSGGAVNTASAPNASVSGGTWNVSSGTYSSVSGGNSRTASGTDDWAAGLLWQDN